MYAWHTTFAVFKRNVSVCDRVECEWVDFRECMVRGEVVMRAKSAIVDPRNAAVTARGRCSISFVKPNNDPVTIKSPTQRQYHTL